MRIGKFILFVVLLFSVLGCGTSKHLKRERYLSETRTENPGVGLRAYTTTDGVFSGKLDLIYEKKVKGSADSPLLTYRGVVGFKSTRHRFLAFDQMTGKKVMRVKHRRGILLKPVIHDSLIVLVKRSGFGQVQVRNILSGDIIKERELSQVRSGPVIASDKLVFGTVGGLLFLTLPDLEFEQRINEESSVDISPVSDSSVIYYATAAGILKAVTAEDGEELWSYDCGSSVVSELNLGNLIYAGLADKRLVAVDPISGKLVWSRLYPLEIVGGTAEFDGRVYFGGTDGRIHCLSAAGGDPIWAYQTEGTITAAPVILGKAVLIGSHDRHLYSLDRISGELFERRRLEGPISLTAAVDNNRIFVTCRKNRLYCFDGRK